DRAGAAAGRRAVSRAAILLLTVFATGACADTLETFQHSVYPRSSGAPGSVTSLAQDEAATHATLIASSLRNQ
ncbi:MAG TPA: hypothetical protein VJ724_05730, partial [Tahibacter sp.]|nr:hypothetical protein [Tahibacter sp.]